VKVKRAVAETAQRLDAAGCESSRVDAELLVGHVLGLSRSELALEASRTLSGVEEGRLGELAERRAAREPLAYVLGEWGFRNLTLAVDPRVLVPRPETEIVVERCLALIAALETPRVLDVGTGSGAIALAIAGEHPGAQVTAIDASSAALEVAGANATRTGIAVELGAWDLFTGLPDGLWDLVVSNPPYVDPDDRDALEPEVRDWEPAEALFGRGATAAVASGAHGVLGAGGALVLEVGDGQAEATAGLLSSVGYLDVRVTPDLAGRDRVVEGRR